MFKNINNDIIRKSKSKSKSKRVGYGELEDLDDKLEQALNSILNKGGNKNEYCKGWEKRSAFQL